MANVRDKKLLRCIALVIKELRDDMGATQESVYNDTNIHIARIEAGEMDMRISTIAELMKFFDLSLSEFFALVEKKMGK